MIIKMRKLKPKSTDKQNKKKEQGTNFDRIKLLSERKRKTPK